LYVMYILYIRVLVRNVQPTDTNTCT